MLKYAVDSAWLLRPAASRSRASARHASRSASSCGSRAAMLSPVEVLCSIEWSMPRTVCAGTDKPAALPERWDVRSKVCPR